MVIFYVNADHDTDITAVALARSLKCDAVRLPVVNRDEKGSLDLAVLKGEAVSNGIVAGPLENGPYGRPFNELQYLVVDSFLGAVAQIGQHAA